MADISATAYLAYKYDTNVFLSWMDQTSQKCGWKSRQAQKVIASEVNTDVNTTVKSAPRLKGKERKLAKQAAKAEEAKAFQHTPSKSTVSTGELAEQIELVGKAVTKHKMEPMPSNVRRALQRCIKARERFAKWYKTSSTCPSEKLESHDHFITILKKATCLFQGENDSNLMQAASSSEANDKENPTMTNMFECLELEDLPEVDEPDSPEDGRALPPPSTRKTIEFDLEPLDAELDFVIFSLFEDVNRTRAEALRIFRGLKAGEISLVKATLSIAVTFNMIRKAEEEALKVAEVIGPPPIFSEVWLSAGTYPGFVNKLSLDRLVQKKGEVTAHMESWTAYEEFVLLPLGTTLSHITQRSKFIKTGRSDLMYPFMSLSIMYEDIPEKLEEAWTQKALEEDRLIKYFYLEMRFLEDLKSGCYDPYVPSDLEMPEHQRILRNSGIPFLDLFHQALQPMWKDNKVSFESAFAARVMLDMHEICGTPPHDSTEQPKEVTAYAERYGFPKENDTPGGLFVRDLEAPDGNNDEVRHLLAQIYKRSSMDLIDPLWLCARDEMGKKSRHIQTCMKEENDIEFPETHHGVWLHTSSRFLLDRNVLFGGTAMVDLALMSEIAERKIADHHFSIFCMAHIYNAARRLGGLEMSWAEMDRVIELQTETLFANDIPTTSRSAATRFMYRTGLTSTDNMNRNLLGTDNMNRTLIGTGPQPWHFQPVPISSVIREYFKGEITLPRLVHQLEAYATEHETKNSRSPTPTPPKKSQVSLTGSLQRIERYLDAVLPDIQFDYLNLTRTCNALFAALKAELTAELGAQYDFSRDTTPLVFIPAELTLVMLLENQRIARQYEEMGRRARKKNGDNSLPVGPQLKYAAEFLRKFLTGEGPVAPH
ncbi:uncharacterized protein GGS22DRAFT_195051 [Annulohypoxylon maeteangense]|uniref:uncharacterized protein n=1 Tax=Annulohypoxylon maeteangense TaxID=1927788 RepID=UPI002007D6E1|nr:uncharacterized protein GGS22DRAFT_195051 [Annulohypoxylon maeteangense]KAI0883881.1 hypothetical protein GGS22DRAFT_195051 [Annulohypoxylon maeteangense]